MKDFRKDFWTYVSDRPELWNLASKPFSMQWGVYVDFFDSAGIRIDIDVDPPGRYEQGDWFDYYVYTKNTCSENEKPFKTRSEARKSALETAIKIYEQ